MSYPIPKIVYGSPAVTLNFTYPPVQKPGTDKQTAVREDAYSSSGLRQSICERVDVYRTVQVDFVPKADLSAWASFFSFALEGNPFIYYPDKTNSGDYDLWAVTDTDFDPKRALRGVSKFSFVMRKEIL